MKPSREAGRPWAVGDLLDRTHRARRVDEIVGPDEPRSHYQTLRQVLGALSADDFRARCATRDRAFRDQGITFTLSGEERPFPLDLVPRIVDADEWAVIEAGVAQRVRALETFLADVYGAGEILARPGDPAPAGHAARRTSTGRRTASTRPTACAIARRRRRPRPRRATGTFRVLEDNLRMPVGRLLRAGEPPHDDPRAARAVRRPPGAQRGGVPGAAARRAARGRAAGRRRPDRRGARPRASTTRRTSSTRSWPARWASSWSRVATCSAATAWSGCAPPAASERVDVIYRRIDDEFLDPVQFRPDSLLGVPGHAQRRPRRQRHDRQRGRQRRRRRQGRLPYVPDMVALLPGRGADPAQRDHLRPATTRTQRDHVLARLDRDGGQAGRRLGRLRASSIGPAGQPTPRLDALRAHDRGRPARLDRPAGRRAVDRARRWSSGRLAPAPPRPAPVRGERRREGVGAARRAHPGGPRRRGAWS